MKEGGGGSRQKQTSRARSVSFAFCASPTNLPCGGRGLSAFKATYE